MGHRHFPIYSPNVPYPPPVSICSKNWFLSIFQAHFRSIQPSSRCIISISDGKVLLTHARSGRRTNRAATHRNQLTGTNLLNQLTKNATSFITQSVAPSTQDKYAKYFKTYTEFCQKTNLIPVPTCQQTLILFATYLAPTMSHKNISQHLAGVKYHTHVSGYDLDVNSYPRLYRLLRGIRRSQGARYNKPARIPITPPLLSTLGRNLWNSSTIFHDKVMLWAAMLTAFYGFLRISEYTSSHVRSYDPSSTLCYEDVKMISHSTIQIQIKASKTDPFRLGVNIQLHRNNSTLCPVQALTLLLAHHPYKQGPLFTWRDGRYLTRSSFSSVLDRIKPQNISNMSTHSFRIGATTTAAAAGHPRWLIQALGRWTSNCYKDYIRIPQKTLTEVSASLASLSLNPTTPFDPDNRG